MAERLLGHGGGLFVLDIRPCIYNQCVPPIRIYATHQLVPCCCFVVNVVVSAPPPFLQHSSLFSALIKADPNAANFL